MFKGLRKKASLLSLSSTTSNELIKPVDSVGSNGTSTAGSDISNRNHGNLVKVLKQVRDFEVALQSMDYLLDDRAPVGVELLKVEEKKLKNADQPAAILPLALGVMEFIEATLGFEPEVMNKAHYTLSEAETASLNNQKYNVKHKLVTSHIYPPGTEFQVTYAELTLLNALVMLLRENNGMVESAKALFKLRKAYYALDAIYKKIKESEPAFKRNLAKFTSEAATRDKLHGSNTRSVSTVDLPGFNPSDAVCAAAGVAPGIGAALSTGTGSADSSSSSLPDDVKLMRDLEAVYQMRKTRIEGTMVSSDIDEDSINLFSSTTSSLNSSKTALSKKLLVQLLGNSQGNTTIAAPRPSTPGAASNGRPSSPMQMLNSRFLKHKERGTNAEEDVDTLDDDVNDRASFASAEDELATSQKFFGDSSALPLPTINDGESVVSGSPQASQVAPAHSNHLHVSTVDEFIHSGVQLCFGILQVVLSLIPPTIGKVLSIVGFKGDRDTGLIMLWRTAITSRNIHGELALLCLLVFYDGPVQFVDVGYQFPGHEDSNVTNVLAIDNLTSISDKELELVLQNPSLYTPQLTTKARKHFPHNALWLLQESRILASKGDLETASRLMQDFPTDKIQMQQIEALLVFDRAMLYAFKHEFDEAARDFIALIDINSWSKGVYLYMAACCYLSKMRMYKMGLISAKDEDERKEMIQKYLKLAEKYFKLAPTYVAGHANSTNVKTGGIGGNKKQMPFDKFLLRKIATVEAELKKNPKSEYSDCFGTAPIHELMYFWNGYNRMTAKELDLSLKLLDYSADEKISDWKASTGDECGNLKETKYERTIRHFLQAIVLRLKGQVSDGMLLLDKFVIPQFAEGSASASEVKLTRNYSPYLYPTVLYERSMFEWLLETAKGEKFDGRTACKESMVWLKKAEVVGNVGDYELSNRTGMRIKAAIDRIDLLSHLKE